MNEVNQSLNETLKHSICTSNMSARSGSRERSLPREKRVTKSVDREPLFIPPS
jgi:hypothetical protein